MFRCFLLAVALTLVPAAIPATQAAPVRQHKRVPPYKHPVRHHRHHHRKVVHHHHKQVWTKHHGSRFHHRRV
jgi:hypothetical protein